MSTMERFWTKVDTTPTIHQCWVWTAAKSSKGYGSIKLDGKVQVAHRVAYETLVGPIPDGLHIDHLCRNRACVNPDHMERVSRSTNSTRANERRWHANDRDRTSCSITDR